MLLTESFAYRIGEINLPNMGKQKIAYIDIKASQDTYYIRNQIKEFGAKYSNNPKCWYWILGKNPENVIRTKVQPCIEWLTQIEDMGGEPKRKVEDIINKLIAKVNSSSMPNLGNGSSKDDILNKLESFKQELVNITSDEEFKKMMEPIIKFKNANGTRYSILNTILILIQDPEATMVKSTSKWKAVNRRVKKNAKPICLWLPKGERAYTEEEQEKIKIDFLREKKVKSVDELTPGDKEILHDLMNKTIAESFDLCPYWFDYRFTEQIPNTEDLVGNPNHDIQWYDDDGEETPELVNKIDATLAVIQNEGIKLSFVDDLGGARGVSKSGTIEILKNQNKNAGMLNTIIHEFAHEILHQTYLKNKNSELRDYFVGTKDGRGKVEQQAELCAWIVMKGFGYDMKTNINYVGIWGLNQDNAVKVFDSVSKVATIITKKITEMENSQKNMTESKRYLKESNIPSGYEIAKMVGCGDIYKKSAMKQKNTIHMTQNDLTEMIQKTVSKILKENLNTNNDTHFALTYSHN